MIFDDLFPLLRYVSRLFSRLLAVPLFGRISDGVIIDVSGWDFLLRFGLVDENLFATPNSVLDQLALDSGRFPESCAQRVGTLKEAGIA